MKVTFTQSYLKGALKWFKPDLFGMDDPDTRPLWMISWHEFGKPCTLDSLHTIAQEINTRYWEHKEEVTHQNKILTRTSTNTNTTSKSSGKLEKSKLSLGNSAQLSSLSNLIPKKSGKTPEPLDKLGKDSKLTSEERKCRFDQNLCMFCGGSSHKAKECLKLDSQAAKARAATTTTMTTMSEAKLTASTEAEK